MDAPPVHYVKTSDGYDIAYCVSGEGPPLVFMPRPMNHLNLYWTENTWYREWLVALASRFKLVQYDGRGQGLSSRGLRPEIAWDDFGQDLKAVIDRLELDDFVLMAAGPFCHLSARYAIRNPDRVRALVWSSANFEGYWMPSFYASLAEQDWNSFLRVVAGMSRAADLEDAAARLRLCTNQNDWTTLVKAARESNMSSDLRHLTSPTLVLHARDFVTNLENSRQVASALTHARLVVINGRNQGDVLQGVQAIQDFLRTIDDDQERATEAAANGLLSARELEVLRLLAAGKSNQQIANELVISLNTVRRHVSNIFDKTGVANRVEAAGYARDHGLV